MRSSISLHHLRRIQTSLLFSLIFQIFRCKPQHSNFLSNTLTTLDWISIFFTILIWSILLKDRNFSFSIPTSSNSETHILAYKLSMICYVYQPIFSSLTLCPFKKYFKFFYDLYWRKHMVMFFYILCSSNTLIAKHRKSDTIYRTQFIRIKILQTFHL